MELETAGYPSVGHVLVVSRTVGYPAVLCDFQRPTASVDVRSMSCWSARGSLWSMGPRWFSAFRPPATSLVPTNFLRRRMMRRPPEVLATPPQWPLSSWQGSAGAEPVGSQVLCPKWRPGDAAPPLTAGLPSVSTWPGPNLSSRPCLLHVRVAGLVWV